MPSETATGSERPLGVPPPRRQSFPFGPTALAVFGLVALVAVAYVLISSSSAPKERIKVGIIQNVKHLDPIIDGFKQGLTELGYEEGVDIEYEYQNANGDFELARSIARDYAKSDKDLLLVITGTIVPHVEQALIEAGRGDIPIVFTNGTGLVESGYLASYKSSGKNITGVVPDDIEITVKKLEFMKAIQPDAERFAVFYGAGLPASPTVEALRAKAPELGLELVAFEIKVGAPQSPPVLREYVDSVEAGDIDAILTVPDPVSNYLDNPTMLIELGKRLKVPIYWLTVPRVFEWGLLSYAQDYIVFGTQAASLADRILKGTPAIEIPLDTSQKNNLIINMRVADELGLTIPEDLVYKANQIIPTGGAAE